MQRVLAIILDSAGCGGAPDAADYGDAGADTLGHLLAGVPWLELPALASLGLLEVTGNHGRESNPRAGASWCRLTETSAGKDTTTGHWELLGCPVREAFATFVAFPDDFLAGLAAISGVDFLGNRAASGTTIIEELGAAHVETGKPILYTSADSVLQIAAHEEAFGLARLLDLCAAARELLDRRGMRVGRVIARPFTGNPADGWRRTGNRHDFSLTPGETALNRLQARGVETIGVGKIADIFANSGVERSFPTKSNADGMLEIERILSAPAARRQCILANLVDFDSLFGHRRDPEGYARCLMEFDAWLATLLPRLGCDDLLLITADHGNDPYHHGTDHTREQVPMLACGLGRPLANGPFGRFAETIEARLG